MPPITDPAQHTVVKRRRHLVFVTCDLRVKRLSCSSIAWRRSIISRVAAGRCFEPPEQFVDDSPLEGTGFEPPVPLLQKALLGVANRDVGTISGTT